MVDCKAAADYKKSEPMDLPARTQSKGKGQRAKGKGQRAKGKGQRAKGKGQRAKGKGQRAKGKGQQRGIDTVKTQRQHKKAKTTPSLIEKMLTDRPIFANLGTTQRADDGNEVRNRRCDTSRNRHPERPKRHHGNSHSSMIVIAVIAVRSVCSPQLSSRTFASRGIREVSLSARCLNGPRVRMPFFKGSVASADCCGKTKRCMFRNMRVNKITESFFVIILVMPISKTTNQRILPHAITRLFSLIPVSEKTEKAEPRNHTIQAPTATDSKDCLVRVILAHSATANHTVQNRCDGCLGSAKMSFPTSVLALDQRAPAE